LSPHNVTRAEQIERLAAFGAAMMAEGEELDHAVRLKGRGGLRADAEVVRAEPALGSAAPAGALEPDRAEAMQHLAMLASGHGHAFTFQTFDDNKERKKAHDERNKERKRAGKKALPDSYARTIHGTLEQRWGELVDLNERGAGVFITVNATEGKRRTTESTTLVRAVFCDLDGSPLEPAAQWRQPNFVIESSPGRYHPYWLVSDMPLQDFAGYQKWLAKRFNGDPKVHDLPRVLRLAGFIHRKDKPFRSRIISTGEAKPYQVADLFSGAGKEQEYTPVSRRAQSGEKVWDRLNAASLLQHNLDHLVPIIFPEATKSSEDAAWRVTSAVLATYGRPDFEEDLSFHANGIVDYGYTGNDDDGQPIVDPLMQDGKRTMLDIVQLYVSPTVPIERLAKNKKNNNHTDDFDAAIAWLKDLLEPSDGHTVDMVCAADVKMRPKEWVWKGHLLRGALELLTGIPGLGKSQVQCYFVACATARLTWPNGAPAIEPVNVIMVTAEDAIDTEVVPRLTAAGADLKRVFFLRYIKTDKHKRQFLLSEDLDRIERKAEEIGNVGLICIDPITAYMGGKVDSHKTTEVRSQLGPLKDFAERTNIAISAITHPPKHSSNRAIDHFIGSQAFIAAGRIGHACFEEVNEDEEGNKIPTGRVLFTNAKYNAYTKMPTLAFRVVGVLLDHDTIETSHVVWDSETVDVTADEAIARAKPKKRNTEREDSSDRVVTFLRDMLKDGPREQTEIVKQASALGYTKWQLRTAREKLSVTTDRKGFGPGGVWMWDVSRAGDGTPLNYE
jgi:putative DNA primase/helicase